MSELPQTETKTSPTISVENLTVKQVWANFIQYLIAIIDEFTNMKPPITYYKIWDILAKEDRLIYLGVFLFIIGIGMYFIDISS